MRRYLQQIGCFVALILVGSFFTLPAVHAQDITLVPEQIQVAAGSDIRFFGNNFGDKERVAWWTTDPSGAVLGGQYVRASGGYMEIVFAVPEDALGGRWAITAYGEETQSPVIATFDVAGRVPNPDDPNDFQAKVAPPAGPAGTQFMFAATGLDDNEDVSYWVTEPGGSVFATFPKGAVADETGRVDLTYTVPINAQSGTWVMTMQGYDSGVSRAVRFDVQ